MHLKNVVCEIAAIYRGRCVKWVDGYSCVCVCVCAIEWIGLKVDGYGGWVWLNRQGAEND